MNQEYSSLRVASSPVSPIFVQCTQEQRWGRLGTRLNQELNTRGGGGYSQSQHTVVPPDSKSRDMPHPRTICMHSEMAVIAPTRHLLINRACATNPLPCKVQYCKHHLVMVLGKSISTPKRKPSTSTDERGVFLRTCTIFEPHLRHFLPRQPRTA